MKTQSWLSAQPRTNSAGARLRAGFTEVLSIGMLIRWIRVSVRPMASGARPGSPRVGGAVDDEHEEEGQDDLGDDHGRQRVAAGRVRSVTVGAEPSLRLKPLVPLAMAYRTAARGDRAQELGDDVGDQVADREPFAGPQADRDRRVQVRARDRAEGVGHGQHGEAEGEGDADEADAEVAQAGSAAELGGQHGGADAAEDQPEGADELGGRAFARGMGYPCVRTMHDKQ